MAAKFELKTSKNGKFYFNLKAANGEVILSSEMYNAKASALNGIMSVQSNAPDDARYVRKTSSRKQPFFVLRAGNHKVIGKSEMYESDAAMEKGIASVKKNGPTHQVSDLTGA